MEKCTAAELEEVMVEYGNMVYRLAYAQTHSRSDADDLYQDVFLRYFQKRPVFETEEHRRAWLLRVTINQAKSLFRSAWFRRTVPLEERISYDEPEQHRLDEALQCLNQRDRALIHLYYYEGCSTREIAQMLDRKESTVRAQLTRARQKLAQIMKGEAYV